MRTALAVVVVVACAGVAAAGTLKERKKAAELASKIIGAPAAAVGAEGKTLGFELKACDDAALLAIVRELKVDNLKSLGFTEVWCVDGANQTAIKFL